MQKQIELGKILDCLKRARALLSVGFHAPYTLAIEDVGGVEREVVYAGKKFHENVLAWSVDEAISEAANKEFGVACATEEFLRPITAPAYSIIQYSLQEGRTQKEMLTMIDKGIERAKAKLANNQTVFTVY